MERIWAAEIVVDAELAATLISQQFPALSPVRAEPIGAGWDNTVHLVNERFVFRFPRREIAVGLLETELGCLPLLSRRLAPIAVPTPLFSGQPSASFPWPFAGYGYIRGVRGPDASIDMPCRLRLARALGRFLKALHAVPPHDLPANALPDDTLARLDARRRRDATRRRLSAVATTDFAVDSEAIFAILDSAPDPPDAAAHTVVAHGDLHIGQLVLNENRAAALAGVIDWGDLHLGHAGVDLAAIHQLLPKELHDAFLQEYGAVDRLTWELARARAAWHAVALLASAADVGDTPLAREARTAIGFIAAAGDQ